MSLQFAYILEVLRQILQRKVGFNQFLRHQLDFSFFLADGAHQLFCQTAMILCLIEAFLVSNTKRCPLVGQFLSLLFKALIFFQIHGLFVLLGFQSHPVGGQRRLKFVNSDHSGLFVFMERGQPLLSLVDSALKHRLMACAAGNDLLGFLFLARGLNAENICGVHALTEMFGTCSLKGGLRRFMRFL